MPTRSNPARPTPARKATPRPPDAPAGKQRGRSPAATIKRRGSNDRVQSDGIPRDGVLSDADALALVMEMMAIRGRSGEEGLVAALVRKRLLAAGAKQSQLDSDSVHHKSPFGGEVGNVILKLPGTTRGPRRMLSAHLDTVPICVGSRPVLKAGRIRSADKATGLGGDDRAGAAVVLATALSVLKGGLAHPPLTFLWTVQEETGLLGARYAALGKLGRPKLAFNFDGSEPTNLTIGATGGYRMTIEVGGVASHAGSHPERGVSAIAIASLAIADLTEHGWHGLIEKGNKAGTSNVGVIHGGEATNVVTDRVTIRAEARSHDAAFRERIVQEMRSAFERAAKRVTNEAGRCGSVRFDGQLDYEAFQLSPREPCVAAAAEAVRAAGHEPQLGIANGGLDANWLTAHGIPTVTLGCGQRNIHTVDEQLDVADFQLARRVALRLATAAD